MNAEDYYSDPDEGSSNGMDIELEEDFNNTSEMNGVQVLDEHTIIDELKVLADKAGDLLHLTTSAACRVMKHFKWDYLKLEEQYFDDPDRLLKKLGIQIGKRQPFHRLEDSPESRGATCPICFDEFQGKEEWWCLEPCNHHACTPCWISLLSNAIQSGRGCSNTTCPSAQAMGKLAIKSCNTYVDESMFQKFLSQDQYRKYQYYLIRSFVETNPRIRWCPSPGCDKALKCNDTNRTIVPCQCGFKCCFKCSDESHAPASCEQMREWKIREAGESDNIAYITAYTKPCPTCKTPIEKNDGCNHMTCTKCQSEGRPPDWCWICGQIWDFKGKHANNWFDCPFKNDPSVLKNQLQIASTESELHRYVHYYEGYAKHEQIRKCQVQKDRERAELHKSKLIANNPGVDAEFIINAVQALIQARTYLKFSYVYAYYLPETSKQFFDWKVQQTEQVVVDFSNMLEDTYRHDWNKTSDPPHSRAQIIDKSALLRHRLADVMAGVEDLEKRPNG